MKSHLLSEKVREKNRKKPEKITEKVKKEKEKNDFFFNLILAAGKPSILRPPLISEVRAKLEAEVKKNQRKQTKTNSFSYFFVFVSFSSFFSLYLFFKRECLFQRRAHGDITQKMNHSKYSNLLLKISEKKRKTSKKSFSRTKKKQKDKKHWRLCFDSQFLFLF